MRLLAPPATGSTVTVGVIGDGQTSIATDAACSTTMVGHVCLAPVGHQAATTLFSGNVTISGNTITLATGSELGSFLADGFAPGTAPRHRRHRHRRRQRLPRPELLERLLHHRRHRHDDHAVSASLTPGTFGPYATQGALPVTLAEVVPSGLFTGAVTYTTGTDPTSGHVVGIVTRTDGGSWLDNGFLEGQLVQFSGVTGTFKIQTIFGSTLSQLSVTAASIPGMLPSSASLSVTEVAPVVTFDSTDWYQPVTVTCLG